MALFAMRKVSEFLHTLILPPFFSRTAQHQRRELRDGGDHGKRGALHGDEGLVHVDAHGVGGREEGLVVGAAAGLQDGADGLGEELLRVACAEVEADGLEDEAFEADDDFAGGFEELLLFGQRAFSFCKLVHHLFGMEAN